MDVPFEAVEEAVALSHVSTLGFWLFFFFPSWRGEWGGSGREENPSAFGPGWVNCECGWI